MGSLNALVPIFYGCASGRANGIQDRAPIKAARFRESESQPPEPGAQKLT